MNKKRFYIDTHGTDDRAYSEVMQFACQLANQEKIDRVVILIATKQSTGWFDRLYGSSIVKKLFKGMTFNNCKPEFKFETRLTYKDNHTQSEIVITAGLDAVDVMKIDSFYRVKAIIAVPWTIKMLEKWLQTWQPEDIRGKQKSITPIANPSCIIVEAMHQLTSSINTVTGINNPFDNALAKTFILALFKYEPFVDAEIIGSYLVRELNWNTQHAAEIEKLINILNNGNHFQGGSRTGLKNYYKIWENKCKDK